MKVLDKAKTKTGSEGQNPLFFNFFTIRSNEGLTLETSALESLYGGQFTLSTRLIKPNYLYDSR